MSLRVYVRPKVHYIRIPFVVPTSMHRLIPFFMNQSDASRQEMCVSRSE